MTSPTRAAPPVTNATRSLAARWSLASVAMALLGRALLDVVEVGDDLPGLFGRLGVGDQVEIFVGNDPFIGHLVEIEDRIPVFSAIEDDRDSLHPLGLPQAKRVEQLVERAVAARKDHERFGSQDEVKLTNREVVELKAKIGRDVGVRFLLVRQINVQADALAANVEGAAIDGLHDAGSAAGGDHEVAAFIDLASLGNNLPESAGLFV